MFVRAVHSVASAVKAVVGDGRSGDPLHERDDKRDVYEGEVAKADSVSERVRRVVVRRRRKYLIGGASMI